MKNGKKEQRFFKGLITNTVHESTGKSFANVYVGMSDDEMQEFSKPASLGKTYTIIVSDYPKSNGTRGQIAKIDKV